jgi:hypothetical protein
MNVKTMCLKLAKADLEDDVIDILKEAGYWDDEKCWKYYGGRENNFDTIGNQQSKPDQALVEKLINSVDAMMIAKCHEQGLNPEHIDAPQSISEAMKRFYNIENGKLTNMNSLERKKLSENICLVASGKKSMPSFSIIDKGEGQTPESMKDTILSLSKSNKLRIPFVQGKFNMGGTGVFQFCGKKNLQLIISKRNPKLLSGSNENDWGITIVRREDPKDSVRSSCYKYLAPNNKILKFHAEQLDLIPGKYPEAFGSPLSWGTFIKLYEYQIGTGLRSNIMMDLNLRFSLLMPVLALPIRLYERRKGYTAHSFETTLSGLTVRLEEDKRENIEDGYPTSGNLNIDGHNMNISIFAFKRDKENRKEKRETYAKNEGVIFTVNGQAHGYLSKSFFTRNAVQLGYIANSILVIINCSEIKGRAREDLFMNSRDRLRDGSLKNKIEKELAELLKNHRGLRELRERRRREDIEGKLEDSRPLAEVLQEILLKSPTLSKLFIRGIRLPDPFNLQNVGVQELFAGKRFPTFFKLEKQFLSNNPKHCPINQKFRIKYKTDAANDYLVRDNDPGKFTLKLNDEEIQNFSLNLWNGTATLQVELPPKIKVNDLLIFNSSIEDIERAIPICEDFHVIVDDKCTNSDKGKGTRIKPPSRGKGNNSSNGQLALPNVIEVRSHEWEKYEFEKDYGLKVIDSGENGYDFYINIDNIHLLTEKKANNLVDVKLLEARYKYGMVLIGLALLREDLNLEDNSEKEIDKFELIIQITRAISPVLLPMISGLSELKENEIVEEFLEV